MTCTRGRGGAERAEQGRAARARPSARPEGRAGTPGSHALLRPGACAPFRFRRAVRQPVDVRQQHVGPAARRRARRPEGHRCGEWRRPGPSERSGTQATARGCVRAGSRAPRGSGPEIGAGGHRPPAPHSDPREVRSEGWSWNSRPACITVPQELRLTFAPGNFCDEKIRLCM